ncbi:TolC family protein [Rahnella bruchi]|uniref:TolC family protein n=1 Tax=Rahnella bruchi TaxID=1510573 RepID=UPI000EA3A3FF|nr:TolC family protein [Rahnella bruchi]
MKLVQLVSSVLLLASGLTTSCSVFGQSQLTGSQHASSSEREVGTLHFQPLVAEAAATGRQPADTSGMGWLKTLLKQGVAYSTEIQGAAADYDAARGDIDQIKGRRLPQVTLSSSSPVTQYGSGNRSQTQKDMSDSSLGISVKTLVTDFGKTGLAIDGAETAARASEKGIEINRNQIMSSIILTVLDIQQYGEQLAISKQHKARMDKLVGMLEQIVAQDQGRRSELVQARARELQALTSITRIESSIADSQQKLIRLTGRTSTVPASLDWRALFIVNKSLEQNIKHNPEVEQSTLEYESGIKNVEALKRDYLPSVNFVINKSTAKDDLGREDAWSAGVNVEWSLYNGGTTAAAQRSAASRATSSKMKSEQLVRDLEYRFRLLYQQRDMSYLNGTNFKDLAVENGHIREMYYEQWFYLNKRSLLDVLGAENEYLNSQISSVNAYYDAYRNNINLINIVNGMATVFQL